MPARPPGEPDSRRTSVLLAGFAFVAVALWAACSLLTLWAGHLLGNAATICASSNWQPWTAGGPATTGFSLAPLGLVCTYPHFVDGTPIRVYPDEPSASLLALTLVLTVIGAWFLLGGHYRTKPVNRVRLQKRLLRAAGVISGLIFAVAGLQTLVMMGMYSKNGMKSSCTDYASQPIGSVGNGVPEATFNNITSIHSLIPTGVLCTFPTASDGKGLVVFGAYENAGAGNAATIAFVATLLAFFLASRLRPELKRSPTTRPSS